jgi:hypothetical protein
VSSLPNFLTDFVSYDLMGFRGEWNVYERIKKTKERLVCDVTDPYYAAIDGEKYFNHYQELQEHLKKPEHGYSLAEIAVKILQQAVPTDVQTADVYIPYAFLHPEKLQTVRGNIEVTPNGHCELRGGVKHEIVRGLDLEHFKGFLKRYIK